MIDSIFHIFYKWCAKRLLRSRSTYFEQLGRLTGRQSSIKNTSMKYINTLHLFRFFWSDERLLKFGTMVDVPHAAHHDVTMSTWAQALQKQIGTSLADIIWTVASTLVEASDAASSVIMRSELRSEMVNVIVNMQSIPAIEMRAALWERFQDLVHHRSQVEHTTVCQLSDLVSGMAEGMPAKNRGASGKAVERRSVASGGKTVSAWEAEFPSPVDSIHSRIEDHGKAVEEPLLRTLAPSDTESSVAAMRRLAIRYKNNVTGDTSTGWLAPKISYTVNLALCQQV